MGQCQRCGQPADCSLIIKTLARNVPLPFYRIKEAFLLCTTCNEKAARLINLFVSPKKGADHA